MQTNQDLSDVQVMLIWRVFSRRAGLWVILWYKKVSASYTNLAYLALIFKWGHIGWLSVFQKFPKNRIFSDKKHWVLRFNTESVEVFSFRGIGVWWFLLRCRAFTQTHTHLLTHNVLMFSFHPVLMFRLNPVTSLQSSPRDTPILQGHTSTSSLQGAVMFQLRAGWPSFVLVYLTERATLFIVLHLNPARRTHTFHVALAVKLYIWYRCVCIFFLHFFFTPSKQTSASTASIFH